MVVGQAAFVMQLRKMMHSGETLPSTESSTIHLLRRSTTLLAAKMIYKPELFVRLETQIVELLKIAYAWSVQFAFAARLSFQIDPATEQAIIDSADHLSQVSSERLADELTKICALPRSAWALEKLQHYGMMKSLWPWLDEQWRENSTLMIDCLRLVSLLSYKDIANVLATILWRVSHGDSTANKAMHLKERCLSLASHLKLSNETAHKMIYLSTNIDVTLQGPLLPWSKLQPILVQPWAKDLVSIVNAVSNDSALDSSPVDWLRQKLSQPIEKLDPKPLVNGSDLQRLGYRPSPAFRQMLEDIRARQLDGQLTSVDEAKNIF